MTATLNRVGAIEPPVSTSLSTTSATTVLTGLTTYIKVVETICLANVDLTNAVEVTLRWVDATPTETVFWQGDVAAGETKIIDNIPLVVDGKGTVRSISAQANTANDIVVTVIASAQSKQAHAG